MQLTGIHHLTAISAQPRENLAFYTGLLGMRLVKKTVNQDDVSAYHLFYADGKANPGTDLTFFDFPAAPERRGTNSISRTGLRVAGEKSLGYWKDRLTKAGGHTGEVTEVDGRLTLPFEDGEGQRLVLVDDGGAGSASPWERSAVPAEHQIRGLGPIVLSVHDLARTERVLTGVMNMRRQRDYAAPDAQAQIHVFAMGEGGPAAELHVIEQKDLPTARQGAGGVHHVAFRTPDNTQKPGRIGSTNSASVTAARSTGSIFEASISASPTASCSRSLPTDPASPPTSRWKRSARNWRCRRSWTAPQADRGGAEAARVSLSVLSLSVLAKFVIAMTAH
jgi:glyoxalase family protein